MNIIESYTISNQYTADNAIWYSIFKCYKDSLTIDSGFSDVLTLNYDELPLYLKSLKECKNTEEPVYMDSGQDDGLFLYHNRVGIIEISIDDIKGGIIGEICQEEYQTYIELLEYIIKTRGVLK